MEDHIKKNAQTEPYILLEVGSGYQFFVVAEKKVFFVTVVISYVYLKICWLCTMSFI